MPRIFDNIEQSLLPTLRQTLEVSDRADFCVGYFNLRGWKQIDSFVERWAGTDQNCCRLLVGMQRLPEAEFRTAMAISGHSDIDNQTALQLKKKLAQEFREQLMYGIPTDTDEAGLRRLAAQIRAGKVVVKLFLRHKLHAKLYLLFRPDPINPVVGYLGSSNLTLSGLSKQGELNVDVMDHDACQKLVKWFEDRWNDHWCMDISEELAEIIDTSWARPTPIPPYHIYLKMAYHLAQEARAGLTEFKIPSDFGNRLFEFQKAAVKIAAHHLNKRGGVLIGDVVGLGKTLMACAVARIFEDDYGLETLVLCPKNLVPMWENYVHQYRLRAKVVSLSSAIQALPELRRYRLVLIDESHNLRNRNGKRYHAIQEYINENESKCIFLTATPYNKTYLDLSNQLRLFVREDIDIGIRPERLLKDIGETEFIRRHQCPVRSLAAFEKSDYADDWRELMRLYLVRRTRSFIQDNYASTDPANGRKFLTFEDGTRSYFPARIPQTVKFRISDRDPNDQYAQLYGDKSVRTINKLNLPRYGLGNYIAPSPHQPPTQTETKLVQDLSRAGKRLMGFCRTNLFKRLESSGHAFILSVERHIVRNFVYLYAIKNNLAIPIGTQDAGLLDARITDEDEALLDIFDDSDGEETPSVKVLETMGDFYTRAAEAYQDYTEHFRNRFKWLRSDLFVSDLAKDLDADAKALIKLLKDCGRWNPSNDEKLKALSTLLYEKHAGQKILVFSQFADTVRYLEEQLTTQHTEPLAGVTGECENPTAIAWRFSPESNDKRERVSRAEELRILVATDILSEGQNLQDCAIVVNYDLPWAIIRLVQRVGRIDRIGQKSENILCYTFLPAEGIERILRLRARVRQRLQENAEVVGTDEAFFEDDRDDQAILDLYNEKAGILDGDADSEVDLASYAYQVWKNATDEDPSLQKIIPELPAVVYSTRPHKTDPGKPEGVLVYLRTGEGTDALAWINGEGQGITQSQFEILRAAACKPDTPSPSRLAKHHELVKKGVELIVKEEKAIGGQLGRPSGARFRTYERLKAYAQQIEGTLFATDALYKTIEDIYRHPLRQSATDTLNRQLRAGISDQDLTQLVLALRDEDRLCLIHEEERPQEPQIICSMGLSAATESPEWFWPKSKPEAKLFEERE